MLWNIKLVIHIKKKLSFILKKNLIFAFDSEKN